MINIRYYKFSDLPLGDLPKDETALTRQLKRPWVGPESIFEVGDSAWLYDELMKHMAKFSAGGGKPSGTWPSSRDIARLTPHEMIRIAATFVHAKLTYAPVDSDDYRTNHPHPELPRNFTVMERDGIKTLVFQFLKAGLGDCDKFTTATRLAYHVLSTTGGPAFNTNLLLWETLPQLEPYNPRHSWIVVIAVAPSELRLSYLDAQVPYDEPPSPQSWYAQLGRPALADFAKLWEISVLHDLRCELAECIAVDLWDRQTRKRTDRVRAAALYCRQRVWQPRPPSGVSQTQWRLDATREYVKSVRPKLDRRAKADYCSLLNYASKPWNRDPAVKQEAARYAKLYRQDKLP